LHPKDQPLPIQGMPFSGENDSFKIEQYRLSGFNIQPHRIHPFLGSQWSLICSRIAAC